MACAICLLSSCFVCKLQGWLRQLTLGISVKDTLGNKGTTFQWYQAVWCVICFKIKSTNTNICRKVVNVYACLLLCDGYSLDGHPASQSRTTSSLTQIIAQKKNFIGYVGTSLQEYLCRSQGSRAEFFRIMRIAAWTENMPDKKWLMPLHNKDACAKNNGWHNVLSTNHCPADLC